VQTPPQRQGEQGPGTNSLKNLVLIWADYLLASHATEIPTELTDRFSVRVVRNSSALERVIIDQRPAAVFFDYDYPERNRLSEFAKFKLRHPSLPIVLVTLQHSESLAVWAYRNGALDYLVKPIPIDELSDCVNRIIEIQKLREKQSRKRLLLAKDCLAPNDIPSARRSKKDRLAPAVYYVQKHFTQKILSDSMAQLCGLSPTHFSRAFKEAFDLTFQEFLLRYRVRRACKLLRTKSPNISDIAYSVGFSDPSYFTRVFKRYLGVNPTEYWESQENGDGQSLDDTAELDMSSTSQIVRRIGASLQN